MVKCHYDKMLLGKTACGRTNYDLASEDIKQVTCKSCLHKVRPTKRAVDGAIWRCDYCDCSNQGSRQVCWHCETPRN